MKDEKHIAEIVVYKIKPEVTENYKTEIIDFFRKLVMSFDRFISYQFFQSCRSEQTFMDLVLWILLKTPK